jgi:hypothetical protein
MYYEFFDNGQNRDDFGVFREDGFLKRILGTTDFDEQDIPWDDIEEYAKRFSPFYISKDKIRI